MAGNAPPREDEGHRDEPAARDQPAEREERWERRLAGPVLVAALVSVPAVFLTLLEDPYDTVGHVGLWLSGAVLVTETVVLFLTSPRKVAWLRRHVWLVLLTVVVVLGVILALGPMQLLRVVQSVGALRVLRAKKIVKAGRIMRRIGPSHWWQRAGSVLATAVVAVFVVVVLADPTSDSRIMIERILGAHGAVAATLLAGALLGAATFVLVRRRREA